MAESFGMDFFEVSAKQNTNISETFNYMAKEIKEKLLSEDQAIMSKNSARGAKIEKKKANKQTTCC